MRMIAILAALVFSCALALADPVGSYDVEGKNPSGGTSYSGIVTVERTGDTYRVVWDIAGTRYFGTGIGNKNFIAVSYRSGNNTGLALYGEDASGWLGVWTYADGRSLGSERWLRR